MAKQIVAIRVIDARSSHSGIAEVVVIQCEDGRGCAALTMSLDDVVEQMEHANDFFIRSDDGGLRYIEASASGIPVDALLKLPHYG